MAQAQATRFSRALANRVRATAAPPYHTAGLAVVLCVRALGVGWLMDDHYHRLVMRGSRHIPALTSSPMNMFDFFDGDPERTRTAIDAGIGPWWTDDHMKARFWRPVSVLTHWLAGAALHQWARRTTRKGGTEPRPPRPITSAP